MITMSGMNWPMLLNIFLAYILGGISFAVIISKYHGVSILDVGSKNPGATNVLRIIGKKAGYSVFILDGVKGALASLLPIFLIKVPNERMVAYICLLACILGHSFSPFLKFKGGKGVATTIGGLFVLNPLSLLSSLLVWVFVFYSKRIVSLASLAFALSLPVSSMIFSCPRVDTMFLILLAVFIFWRHRSNFKKLLNRSENRF